MENVNAYERAVLLKIDKTGMPRIRLKAILNLDNGKLNPLLAKLEGLGLIVKRYYNQRLVFYCTPLGEQVRGEEFQIKPNDA